MLQQNETAVYGQSRGNAAIHAHRAGGYRLVTKDFETRIEPVSELDGPPDYITTFPPGVEGYVAAHDEAIAYLEDVIADCLETLKELKDSRWVNAQDLVQNRSRTSVG